MTSFQLTDFSWFPGQMYTLPLCKYAAQGSHSNYIIKIQDFLSTLGHVKPCCWDLTKMIFDQLQIYNRNMHRVQDSNFTTALEKFNTSELYCWWANSAKIWHSWHKRRSPTLTISSSQNPPRDKASTNAVHILNTLYWPIDVITTNRSGTKTDIGGYMCTNIAYKSGRSWDTYVISNTCTNFKIRKLPTQLQCTLYSRTFHKTVRSNTIFILQRNQKINQVQFSSLNICL